MIIVKVKGVADIGKMMNAKGEQDIALPDGPTLRDLLDILSDRFGEAFKGRIYEIGSKELRKDLRLLLNGKDISFLSGLETELHDGDRFSLVPPLAGG